MKLEGSSNQKTIGNIRLPPVKLKSKDKPLAINWEEKFERHGLASRIAGADGSSIIESFFVVTCIVCIIFCVK